MKLNETKEGAMKKFTFCQYRPTGKWASFESESHDIKLDKLVVGHIQQMVGSSARPVNAELDGKFKVSLAVKKERTEDNPAPFKWVYLKKNFDDAATAKEFLNSNVAKILEMFDLYKFED
jgi:hypothetical protein